jgi:predicted glycosyltransferase
VEYENGKSAGRGYPETPMSVRPTILFHPPNHVGLGHINRLSAIALALRQMRETVRSVFVVEGAGHALLDALGLPFVPLPSSHALYETECWTFWSECERLTLLEEVSRAIVRSISPQLVVFDCFPTPAFATAVLERKIPVVLCLREMQDLRKYLSHVHDLMGHVALILIPHELGAFEVPEAIRMKSCFIGQIVRPFRTGMGPPSRPERLQVVITGGGGGYPGTASFYNLAMKALVELQRDQPTITGRLITGPLFQDWSQLELGRGVTVTPFEPDTLGAFSAADLVVSAAGYNTSAELEQIGVRTILVPAERLWDDQYARSNRLTRRYSHFRTFSGSSVLELARVMHEVLQETTIVPSGNSSDGSCKAAELLCSMLERS